MRVLGAILCGGRSRRFGSDKAMALLDGLPLAEHVRRALAPQVEALVACGRPILDLKGLADRPGPELGPLAGLNAALHAGLVRDFDAVLAVPCDAARLPDDLRTALAPGPAYVAELPVVGLWPCTLAPSLDTHLAEDARRSMRGWAERAGARAVTLDAAIPNINAPEDLARLD